MLDSLRPHGLAAHQASLSLPISQSFPKFMSIESVLLSNHLILCCPLLFLPSIFSSIRVFSNELAVGIKCPKYWSFSFSIRPSSEYLGSISFNVDWFDLLVVQGTLKSLLQNQSSKTPIDEGPKCQHKVHSQGLLIPGPTGFSLYGALYKLS